MTRQRTPVEQDAFQAWVYARNCLLYENDPGPAELNVGTAQEPHLVPRSLAWQQGYAMNVLVKCDGDHTRLLAAARECQAEAIRRTPASPHRAREWTRAADLCNLAAAMVEGAGGHRDDKARQRVVASCRHETMMMALGSIPAVAETSAQELIEQLAVIDAEPADPEPAFGSGRPPDDASASPLIEQELENAAAGLPDIDREPLIDRAAIAELVACADQVAWAPDRDRWHELIHRLSGRRLYRRYRTRRTRLPDDVPWTDVPSFNRPTWRTRTAYLAGAFAFAVDYQVCRTCGLGWVEDPYTEPVFQRSGLARTALTALRSDYPGLSWHTLGGHSRQAVPFWDAVGAAVPGGYTQRRPCPHIETG
ncbi:hypothetical protein Sme01_62660 [Sphaerisporangium melleum]|uniref:Uncharacterized protein n=1 Tax=Sphaerisporangium melleum TaxID=321316 RepID=A0A917VID9_9ACTN|nr:hypothetical protein [Sphaerisporangium melleum]GGK81887.1 hypothetical protein GCM10007964_25680 [Sphaerisporangium melleum]GII73790.1 hypothetical protein Sme01_62660 [Sphaerisporangium melleum]